MNVVDAEMKDEWLAALRAWAARNECVQELWLFGSRAKGTSNPNSDIDIAIGLMPPAGKTNWALAAYIQSFDDWKQQLRDVLSWDVSLTAIGPGFDMDEEVRRTGVLLWRRNT